MMKTISKHSFTLLEIIIALSLLTLVASFSGIKIKQMIDHSRFEKQVSSLLTTLKEAQVLSSVYRADLRLEIFKDKGYLFYQFTTDEPLPKIQFSQEKVEFSLIKQVFVDRLPQEKVVIDIYAGGRIAPAAVLTFSSQENRALHLDLKRGHLAQLKRKL